MNWAQEENGDGDRQYHKILFTLQILKSQHGCAQFGTSSGGGADPRSPISPLGLTMFYSADVLRGQLLCPGGI